MSALATPFHLRPSAQPFIFRRQTPVGTREVSAPAQGDALVDYAHLPSVGTWMMRPSQPQGSSQPLALESEASDARVAKLIEKASVKSLPPSLRTPRPEIFEARFQPSVGTWLQRRQPVVSIPPASLAALRLPAPQDEHSEVLVVQSRALTQPEEPEESFDLHFGDVDFTKDPESFEMEILKGFMALGCSEELVASLKLSLRPGVAGTVAEIRGPERVVQWLKSMPVHTLKAMGCQAQSAAAAAAATGVIPVARIEVKEADAPAIPPAAGTRPGSEAMSLASSPARQPLLGRAGAESRTPFLSGTPTDHGLSPGIRRPYGFRRMAMPLTDRRKAGAQRLSARDAWNVEELRISDIMSRSGPEGSSIEPGLDSTDFRDMLLELYGTDPEPEAVHWTFQLASRGGDRCTSTGELHYAFRAHHHCHFLPQETMRTLAMTKVTSKGLVDTVLLQHLMEELNDGYTVPAAEVKAVLEEADALAAGGSGRAALLRAISAWYLNVERSDSPWAITLRACYGRWFPKRGYHHEALERFRSSLLDAKEAFHEERARENATQAVWLLVQAALCLAALLFSSCFFLWLVILGAEHGDDRCPKDLDGLITWFGSLGLASIVVGLVDKHDRLKVWSIGLALKVVLFIVPWVGAFWTFHLSSNDQQTCGLFLTGASSLLWTVLLIAELVLGLAFLWHLAVFSEHEMSLRKGHQLPV